jgi:hypothetical protein
MPLRDLPTESKAATGLLQVQRLRHRVTVRRTGWHGPALAGLAVTTVLSILLPGSASTGCYLWRATTQPVSGRGPALALPLAMVVVVLADRLWADRIAVRRQVRGWAAVGLTVLTAVVWTGLVVQGRSGCATSPAVIGAIACGALAATVCAHWATRDVPVDEVLPERPEKSSDQPLNQSELRATFV